MKLQIQAVEAAQKRQHCIDSEQAEGNIGEYRNMMEKLNSQLLQSGSADGHFSTRSEALGT